MIGSLLAGRAKINVVRDDIDESPLAEAAFRQKPEVTASAGKL